jgi:hypothetical protein
MTFFRLIKMAGLVAGMLLAAVSARAQQPIIGGALFVASPGTVNMTFHGSNTPPTVLMPGVGMVPFNWHLTVGWSTGSGPIDLAWRAKGFTFPVVDGFSSVPRDSVLSTPDLTAGTLVFAQAAIVCCEGDIVTGLPGKNTVGRNTIAAVFPGPGNTARIGFPAPNRTQFSNFLDYPLRVLISNVCVR